MNTIKEIQELATQTDDWTKKKVAEKLMEAIWNWRLYSRRMDKTLLELHEWLAFIANSYPKHPDNIPQSVVDAVGLVNAMELPLNRRGECSMGAKAHAERIEEYLTFLSIWNEDRDRLWEEIAQKEDN
jgi:hypothetical protein